jgi:hypothetical protein
VPLNTSPVFVVLVDKSFEVHTEIVEPADSTYTRGGGGGAGLSSASAVARADPLARSGPDLPEAPVDGTLGAEGCCAPPAPIEEDEPEDVDESGLELSVPGVGVGEGSGIGCIVSEADEAD